MSNATTAAEQSSNSLLIGVLALQGAFEEHQVCLEQSNIVVGQSTTKVQIQTRQVRTPSDLDGLDGIVLPGGESTAMGLIGTATTTTSSTSTSSKTTTTNLWDALQDFILTQNKPCWGTCAGMILLADKCVGASAVIENGQSLIGGMNILVCRNYFGSQVSSFEMATPPPPTSTSNNNDTSSSYPGVFIRAPAILSVGGPDVEILGKVVATPCRQAACVLEELETKIANGEQVIQMGVVDSLERNNNNTSSAASAGGSLNYRVVIKKHNDEEEEEEKKEANDTTISHQHKIELPGAADESNAREVICAVRRSNILCTAFHPELTNDYRWHEYFVQNIVLPATSSKLSSSSSS